jgi:2-methylcitrate dehydratase PrpD
VSACSATKAILNWMYSTTFEDLPPEVRQIAVLALYDGIGCSLACSLLPVAHRMVDFVKAVGGPLDCSMIGFPLRTSILNAALVNGTLGHGDEVDALPGDARGGHIQAAVMAATLTAGQLAGASGQEVLRGMVLGYELSKRIDKVGPPVEGGTRRGSGSVDVSKTMGATAAAGIALGLPPDRMEVALSLAGHMACGIGHFSRETGHMAKSFVRGGVGARNGVAAALMSKVGYEAPQDVFDGPQSFFHSRLGLEEPGPEFLHGLGDEYGIRSILFKRQSAAGPNQAARQALLDLMAENGLAADDIAEILVEVDPAGFDTITSVHDPSIYGKDVLALAAVYGGMGFREAHQETFYKSLEVQSMRERIKIQARRDWTWGQHRFHAVVAVMAKDGRKLHKETDYRRMTEEELDTKFSYLVGLRAGETKANELVGILKRLDTVSNMADVMIQLELPERHVEQL